MSEIKEMKTISGGMGMKYILNDRELDLNFKDSLKLKLKDRSLHLNISRQIIYIIDSCANLCYFAILCGP